MIALTKNTTVVATIGVAEAAYMMREMLEFDISQIYADLRHHGGRLRDPDVPMGIFFTWLSRRLVVQR